MKRIEQTANQTVDSEAGKFTNGVWQEELLAAQVSSGMRVHRFYYAPGSHSHWHSHTGEQALLFVSGRARLRKLDEAPFEVGPGDLVYVAPGEKHRHGAAANQFLVHYAFTASGKTDWFEEVTEAEYTGGSGPA